MSTAPIFSERYMNQLPSKNNKKCYMNGFSLLELLVTISIMLMLVSLIIPSQKLVLVESKIDVMRMQLVRAINLTQIEAITRKEAVTLCPSLDQITCSGHWKDGYIILANKKVIYSFMNPVNQGQLYWRAFPSHQSQLDYLPSGMLRAENGTFWYCLAAEKNPRWVIVLSQSGRAREVVPEMQVGTVKEGETILRC